MHILISHTCIIILFIIFSVSRLYNDTCILLLLLVSLARRSRMEGTSGDCSLLSVCKRNFINCVIDMLSQDKHEIIT